MEKFHFFWIGILLMTVQSCISTKDVQYLQPNENLSLNAEGLVPYNIPIYRVTKNDILTLNIITTPKGDAAQFYSAYNVSHTENGSGSFSGQGGNFYFRGLKVDSKGDINVFGIGFINAEGRTLEEITADIQAKVNENFLEGKSEVRLNLDGIRYTILGDIETIGMNGEKVAYKQSLNLTEAFAMNGGLNRSVDRKNVILHRKYPEGIKIVKIDLTREDLMNSPYYWVQNGDEIFLNTRKSNMHGFGKDPINTLSTGSSILTGLMSLYLLFSRL